MASRRANSSEPANAASASTIAITVSRAAAASPPGACSTVKMAIGRVRVSPGMLETKVMVAPNSPRQRANASTTPDRMPGSVSGRVMVANTRAREAPRVRAAVSSLASTASMASRIARTSKGNAITPAATAAPCQVKITVMPKVSYSQPPIAPRRPSATSSK